jgi:hypothetical protein
MSGISSPACAPPRPLSKDSTMSWFQKIIPPRSSGVNPPRRWCPRACGASAQLRGGALCGRPGQQPACLPPVRPSPPHRRAQAAGCSCWTRRAQRDRRQRAAGGFAQVQGQPALSRPSFRGGQGDRGTGCPGGHGRQDAWLPVTAAAFEFRFMGGSMGSVVGERFVRGVEASVRGKKPFVCVAASGGARMQEGLEFPDADGQDLRRLDPAFRQPHALHFGADRSHHGRGVSASFAMLGDIIVAEPNALIGFAGPRVIEQTVRETCRRASSVAEFLVSSWRRRPDRRPPRNEENPGPALRPAYPQDESSLTLLVFGWRCPLVWFPS